MAIMYPDSLKELEIEAEREVYEALKTLNNHYHVFHSVRWRKSGIGECDFIIFNPFYGFLTLEVKGGIEIGKDKFNNWYSIDHKRIKHTIKKDPAKQSEDARWYFLKAYNHRYQSYFNGIHGFGVCFPGVNSHTHLKGLNFNSENILLRHQLKDPKHLEEWIKNLFQSFNEKDKKVMLSEKEKENFIELLNPGPITLNSSIDYQIAKQEEKINEISQFNDYIIDLIDDRDKIVFIGAAGTGKTWLAKKKAIHLNDLTKKTLYLCYNSELMESVKNELASYEKVEVNLISNWGRNLIKKLIINYINSDNEELFLKMINDIGNIDKFDFEEKVLSESFFKQFLKDWLPNIDQKNVYAIKIKLQSYNGKIPQPVIQVIEKLIYGEEKDYYNKGIPEGILEIAQESNWQEYFDFEAILLDEAQGLSKEWCQVLELILERMKKPIIYIFFDDNQNTFRESKEMPIENFLENKTFSVFRLKYNLRNNKNIHQYAIDKTSLGKTSRSFCDLDLLKPEEFPFLKSQKTQTLKKIENILDILIKENKIDKKRIIILSPYKITKSLFSFEQKQEGKSKTEKYKIYEKYYVCDKPKFLNNDNTIQYKTIDSVIGMEFDIVILILFSGKSVSFTNYNEKKYIGMTRAKHHLYVININLDA